MKNRLKVLRAERDWSQAQLAELLDVSRQTVNAIETGKYDPSLPLAFGIAQLFGLRIEEIFEPPPPALAALNLRTSMRNQLPCTVRALKANGASVRVELALADGSRLHARITRESTELLELKPGTPVLALCKATAVAIARTFEPRAGHNLLPGSVARATARDEEVALQLNGGLRLVGFAGALHGLKAGQLAMALLDEASVVIAVTS